MMGIFLIAISFLVSAQADDQDMDARCEQQVKGIGICDGMTIGYQYNQETETCEMKEVSGCGADSPFSSLKECQEVCEEMPPTCISCCKTDADCEAMFGEGFTCNTKTSNCEEKQDSDTECPIDCVCDSEGRILECEDEDNVALNEEGASQVIPSIPENIEKIYYFYLEDSPYCEFFEIELNRLIDNGVLNNIDIEKISLKKNNKLITKYEVAYVPTIVIGWDSKICKMVGYSEDGEFLSWLSNPSSCVEDEEKNEPLPSTEENESSEEVIVVKEIPKDIPSNVEYVCNGCELEDNCYTFGYRKDNKFCSDLDNQFIEQKKADSSCENNFECNSNLCIDNQCISSGLWQKIISWIKGLFGS